MVESVFAVLSGLEMLAVAGVGQTSSSDWTAIAAIDSAAAPARSLAGVGAGIETAAVVSAAVVMEFAGGREVVGIVAVLSDLESSEAAAAVVADIDCTADSQIVAAAAVAAGTGIVAFGFAAARTACCLCSAGSSDIAAETEVGTGIVVAAGEVRMAVLDAALARRLDRADWVLARRMSHTPARPSNASSLNDAREDEL